MEILLDLSVKLHLFFAILVLLVALYHVAILWAKKEFIWLFKKIHWWIPTYYFLLSGLFFTGLVAWTSLHFYLSHWTAMMILAWALMLGGSIVAYKLFKRTKTSNDPKFQEAFKKFASRKYLFDCLIVIGIYFGAS
ncbi:MAG: hypothetical protein GX780_03500 [Campylobacteraceae bacterium]|nr:hypothetical protein [Campylobacteraceae bacterium]